MKSISYLNDFFHTSGKFSENNGKFTMFLKCLKIVYKVQGNQTNSSIRQDMGPSQKSLYATYSKKQSLKYKYKITKKKNPNVNLNKHIPISISVHECM